MRRKSNELSTDTRAQIRRAYNEGISQADIARKHKITQSTVSRAVTGKRTPQVVRRNLAVAAMQGLLANSAIIGKRADSDDLKLIVGVAVDFADALMDRLEIPRTERKR